MEKEQNERLWSGSFIKICVINFFIFLNFHSLLPTFPFFVQYLGGDAVMIGVATALFSIAAIFLRPIAGWLVDTWGRFSMLLVGLIGLTVIPLGYSVAAGIAMAVILRTVNGVFHAASSNAATTWATDIIPRTRMGEGLGMYGLSMALSTAVAPALGLALMGACGFGWLFVTVALTSVIAMALTLSIKSRNYKLSNMPLRLGNLFEKKSLMPAVTQFFFMMAFGVVEVYVAIYAANCGLPNAGMYFIVMALATVAARIFLGRTIDRHGVGGLVYSGIAAIVAGLLVLVFLHNVTCFLLSGALLGFSFGAVQPSLQTLAMQWVAPERRGAANSTFFVAFDAGIAIGGFLAGLMVKYFSYDTMFLWLILPCVISLMCFRLKSCKSA